MSYYLKSGNTFRVATKESMDLHENLPADNYVIKQNMSGELYLESINTFEIKGKVYGNATRNRDRILNTFFDRPACTGVMLSGEKGSGKSLLAKAICAKGVEDNIPSIIINAPWSGDKFNAFLQTIEQPTIILFDEFEKVYSKEEQESILTLLDGVFPSKKLFIFTCNDKWRVDQHMRNRPGRIFYMIEFKGLDCDFITEYCKDNLKNQTYIERICGIAALFSEFNFDMLKALVEEMNRYNESPDESLKMLNAKPEFDQNKIAYHIELIVGGIPIEKANLDNGGVWEGNPALCDIEVEYYTVVPFTKSTKYEDPSVTVDGENAPVNPLSKKEWNEEYFSSADIKKVDIPNNRYYFVNSNGATLILTKAKEVVRNYLNMF